MKLRGKLILSCAALAAVATTAFSTTYAWYTSNDTVTATGLTAKTETDGSDSLQISSDGSNWKTTIDLSTVINTDALKLLKPVERTAATNAVGTFKLQNGDGTTNPVSDTSAAAGTGIVQFVLYFRNVSSATSAVYLNAATYSNTTGITTSQTTPVLPNTKLIADLNANYTTAANTSYSIDILRALDFEIAVETGTVKEGQPVVDAKVATTAEGSGYTGVSAEAYNLEQTSYSDTVAATNFGTWDALDYYNTVKGLTGADAATRPTDYAEPATKLESIANKEAGKLADTTPLTVVKTTWTLYLDGWDKACFDAVKAQSVKFDFTFATSVK